MTSALAPVPVPVAAERGPRLLWLPAGLYAAEGLGLLVLFVSAVEGPDPIVGAAAGLLLLASAGAVLRRPAGHTAAVVLGGLVAAATPGVLAFIGVAAGGVLAGAVLVALPFGFLLAPSVWAWRRPQPDRAGLPWPEGWRRQEAAGVLRVAASVVVVAVVLAGAAIEGRAGSPGAAIAAFGCGLAFAGLSVASLSQRDGVAAPLVVDAGIRRVGGVGFAASARYPAGTLLAGAGLGVLLAGVALIGQGPARIASAAGAVLAIAATVVLSVNRLPAEPRLLLAPEVVVLLAGTGSWTVPWTAVAEVRAFDQTTYGPGGSVHAPFVGLVVDPPDATRIGDGQGGRIKPSAQRGGVQVFLPARALDADPVLVYWALRFYAAHATQRVELADGRALQRMQLQAFSTPPVPV